ncbi:MAG TPA: carbon-nitrogen hydrolase [Candidatus Binatia bacterium]|nr:carbon-nitrogen hydrolase [Candidatus Binatia bacterium]
MARRRIKDRVKIGLVQMSAAESPRANLDKAIERVEAAAKKGAQIVCLQELFRSRYFCQSESQRHFKLAETIPGPSTEALGAVARDKEIVIVAPLFERRSAGVYHNSAVILDADGSIAGRYRKMHIPDDPLYYEKFYFTPGDLGFPSFQTRYARIAALVCWDQWFPEGARSAALSGAEILFYPTAIGWIPGEARAVAQNQRSAWELIQRSHAVANGVFVAAVNRVGREGKIQFWGRSFVAGPLGEIVAQASGAREEVLLADLDLGKIEETRQSWPFLRDRRIDAYGPLLSRTLENAGRL